MSLSIKKKAIKKAISVVTMVATVTCMSSISMLNLNVALADVADGALIKSNATNSDGSPTLSSLDVYIVKLVGTKKFKRLVLNPTVFNSYGHLNWGDIQTVSESVMDEYTSSGLVRVDTDPDEKVYAMAPNGDIGSKSWVNMTGADFLGVAGSEDGDSIYTINSTDAGNYTAVGDLTTVVDLEAFYSAGTLPGAVASALTVALSADTPASGFIVANQASADLAHFTFTGTGTLNTVVLQRTGISDQNTLSNIYLYDGMTRLSDGYSFNNVGQLTMNGLGIVLSGSKVISVKADVANVSNASSLGVNLVGYTPAGGTATTVNVAGNVMSYGVGSLATAYLAANTITGTPSVNAGTSAYTVWSSSIQVNTRAISLKGANFRIIGSAPADALGNIKLYVDGIDTGIVAVMGSITGSNYAMFDLSSSPVNLATGSHTFDVRADIVKGASYTFQVALQQATDLVIYDGQVGVNIAILGPVGVAFTSNSAALVTINAGTASVTVDPTFQSLSTVTGGATNLAIAKFKIHGYGEDVKVSTLSVLPILSGMGTPAASGLNNVTLYFDGTQVGSSSNWTTGTIPFTLGSQMIVPAGTDSYVEVRADLQTTAGLNYVDGNVSANLVVGSTNAQGQSSQTTLNFPTSTVVGTVLAVQTGTLSVSKSVSYADQTISPNLEAAKIGSYTLQNQSSSEGVRVTSLLATLSGSTPLTNLTDLKTSETSGSGANPVQPQAANTFSVDFTLAPNETKTIDIFANTSSSTASSSTGASAASAGTLLGGVAAAGTAQISTASLTGTTGTYALTVNGTTYATAATGNTTTDATSLAALVDANAAVTAVGSTADVVVTAAVTGTAFTITNFGSVPSSQVVVTPTTPNVPVVAAATATGTVTLSGVPVAGDIITMTVQAETVTYTVLAADLVGTAAANLTAIAVKLAALSGATIGAGINTMTSSGAVVTITAAATGVAANSFVLSTSYTRLGGNVITTLVVTSIGASSNVSLLQNGTGTAVTGQTISISAGTVTNPPTFVPASSTYAQFTAAAVSGSTDGSKAKFNLASTGGSSVVTELKFTVTESVAGTTTSVKVGDVTAPVVGTVAWLTGLNLAVPNGGSGLNIDAYVSYAPVGIGGVASNSTTNIGLTYVKYISGGTTGTFSPTGVDAPTMVLVGSRPTFTVTGSDATLANGLVELGRVTVSADAKGDIKLGKLAISVSVTGAADIANAADNIIVKDTSGTVIATKNALFTAATGTNPNAGIICFDTTTAACASGSTAANAYLITAGDSQTFVIYASATNVSGAVNTMAFTTSLGASSSTTWYDVAGNNTSVLTAASVFNYPTNTSVITN